MAMTRDSRFEREAKPIEENEAWLYVARLSDWRGHSHWSTLDEFLDADERERRQRFVFEKDRDVYTLAHGMLRSVLSLAHPVSEEAWRFESSPGGRPEIASPSIDPRLRFSLSHSGEWAAVAVCRQVDIGVDLEDMTRRVDLDLTTRSFSAEERKELARRTGDEQRAYFFSLWTLKESYMKGTGQGLSTPLDAISFSIDAGDVVHFDSTDVVGGPSSRWRFRVVRDWPGVCIATANVDPAGALRWRDRFFLPG